MTLHFIKRIRDGGTSLIVTIPKEIESVGYKNGDLCKFTIEKITEDKTPSSEEVGGGSSDNPTEKKEVN